MSIVYFLIILALRALSRCITKSSRRCPLHQFMVSVTAVDERVIKGFRFAFWGDILHRVSFKKEV